MMQLRKKLGEDVDSAAGHFQTEAGVGYRFVSKPEAGGCERRPCARAA